MLKGHEILSKGCHKYLWYR